uniref:endoribonuclease Dicer n=1 Tax=Ciona intestinalis TaxID=7719 RepID=UPI0005213CC5|nr:endoribonuclease Dicer [Ciona intestinalis]|eukprot:XP_009860329.1 endoribonuclease Dicer [Ciona intestinalis]
MLSSGSSQEPGKPSWTSNSQCNSFIPRPYQIELLECAAKQNTIICLNGDFGKCFMYTMFLREVIIKHNGKLNNAPKFAVLLLKEDCMVNEQSELLRSHLDVDIISCTHNMTDSFTDESLQQLCHDHQVLVCTPEVFVKLLSISLYIAQYMDLVIFDDCHLVNIEMHPIRKIMKILDENRYTPMILGLTSSLLNNNITADELNKCIHSMETVMHCKAQTATDLIAVDRHNINPPVENIILSSDENKDGLNSQLLSDIRKILNGALEWLNSCQIVSTTRTKTTEWQLASTENEEEKILTNYNSNTSVIPKTSLDVGILEEEDGTQRLCSVKSPPLSECHEGSKKIVMDKKEKQEEDLDVCTVAIQLINESLMVADVLGPWCVYQLIVVVLKQLQKNLHLINVHLNTEAQNTENGEVTSGKWMWQAVMLQYVQTKFKMVYSICHWYMGDQKAVNLAFVAPKVHRLIQVLKEYKPVVEGEEKQNTSFKYNNRNESDYVSWWQDSDAEDEDADMMEGKKEEKEDENHPSLFINTLCGIVFVEERYVAMMLQRLLRELSKEDKNLKHVSSSHLTPGVEGERRGVDPASMDQSKQEEVLRKFRSHESNLLICTGDLEDCAYMPKCNLIMRFDVPKSYRSYAESKSRARAQTSAYVMLVRETEKSHFMEKLQEYKKIEKVLLGPDWSLNEVYDNNEDDDIEEMIPPYILNRNTQVNMKNAVRIVNRYCNRLPSDPFTHLSPRCEVVEVLNDGDSPMFMCILQLPINSHVREPVQGIVMPTLQLAQQAVAMETCKVLYEAGELDENLMPIGKETVKYAEELDPWKREVSSITGRPGSTKKRQTYNKDSPQILRSCLPQPDINLFIYEIEMKIKNPLLDELNVRRRKLFFPEETSRCFGILTTKPIPQIPGFPIFTRSGEESAKLKFCRGFVQLSAQQIKLVRIFHRYVFSDMLRVDRVPLSFQPEKSTSQLLVVVLNKVGTNKSSTANSSQLNIDWSFMMKTESKRRVIEKMKSDPWYKHKMNEQNKVFVFNRQLYEDGVVVAKYRSCDQPNRFYVAELKDDMTPLSSFPSSEYESFLHYYQLKYGLDIRCLKQPLLDVDHTSSRLNLLTPRHLNQKGKALPMSSLEKKRAKYESLHNRQILVPELCEVHPIPASLWRKAVCLPSVLYRVNQLLIAEELRKNIAFKSGITMEQPPIGNMWQNLHFGWTDNEDSDDDNEKLLEKSPAQRKSQVDEISSENNEVLNENKNVFDENIPKVPNSVENDGECAQHDNLEETNHKQNQHVDFENSTAKSDVYKTTVINHMKENHDEDDYVHVHGSNDVNVHKKNINHDNDSDRIGDTVHHGADDENVHDEKNDVHYHEVNDNHLCDDDIHDSDDYIHNENKDDHCHDNIHNDDDDDDDRFSFSSHDYEAHFDLSDHEDENMKNNVNDSLASIRGCKKKIKDVENPIWISSDVIDDYNKENPVKNLGPGPGLILQALTLSNASDGFNLERLEMLGDSFLKHAVTVYLYCTYPESHEGKLSYMRSKKVSNYNLYRIGKQFGLAGKMTGLIFDPTVNWLPTGFVVGASGQGQDSDEDISDDDVEIGVWTGIPSKKKVVKKTTTSNAVDPPPSLPPSTINDEEEIYEEDEIRMIDGMLGGCIRTLGGSPKGDNGLFGLDIGHALSSHQSMHFTDKAALRRSQLNKQNLEDFVIDTWTPVDASGKPLNNSDPLMLDLHTQHSLADKSIADCVEALLGAYLTTCGHRSAQLLLCHLGLNVLPKVAQAETSKTVDRFGYLTPPTNKMLECRPNQQNKLDQLLVALSGFERKINYTFKNKAYLLQAFTHASYYYNTVTDCYQRLEFLGDAVLDFLITRHLFNDERHHSPGALTDLRSALVNNTIFASLAVHYDFHKYFKSISPELHHIIEDFVMYQQKQEDAQGMDAHLMRDYDRVEIVAPSSLEKDEEEGENEDVEVPKALGDIFESVAGAIYMDSGMDLSSVWKVYSVMMLPLIEKFSACVPRSPVRELLEMEPETAKFSCAEKRYDGKVRVTVEIIGKGRFKGVGRSYRIAKSAAARRALRYLKGPFIY